MAVINLARSVDRRARMDRAFAAVGLPFSFFPAIDANDAESLSRVSRYCPRRARWFRRRIVTPGEVACFASHYLLWEQCADSGQPLLIMEDDVDPEPWFADAVALADSLIADAGMLRLFGLRSPPYVYVEKHGSFRVARYLKGPRGGQCYALSPEGAARLLKISRRWIDAVDVHFDRFWIHGMGCFALHPFAVQHLTDVASDIGERGLEKRVASPIGALVAPVSRAYHAWGRRFQYRRWPRSFRPQQRPKARAGTTGPVIGPGPE